MAYQTAIASAIDYRVAPGEPVTGTQLVLQTLASYVVPADESQPPINTSAGVTFGAPAQQSDNVLSLPVSVFSPDSRHLMLIIPSGTFSRLFVMPTTNPLNARRELAGNGWRFTGPLYDFTPDGGHLVYSTRDGLFSLQLTTPVRLWADPLNVAMTSWSIHPLGGSVLYVLDPIAPESRAQVYLTPIDGLEASARLVGQGVVPRYLQEPAWMANGRYMLFGGRLATSTDASEYNLYSVPFASPQSAPTLLASMPIAQYLVNPAAGHLLVLDQRNPARFNYIPVQGPPGARVVQTLGMEAGPYLRLSEGGHQLLVPDYGARVLYTVLWMGGSSTLRPLLTNVSTDLTGIMLPDPRWFVYALGDGILRSVDMPAEFAGAECAPAELGGLTPALPAVTQTHRLYLPSIGVCN